MIKVDISQVQNFVSAKDIKSLEPEVKEAILKLEKGTGAGNDFIGWTDLAQRPTTVFWMRLRRQHAFCVRTVKWLWLPA